MTGTKVTKSTEVRTSKSRSSKARSSEPNVRLEIQIDHQQSEDPQQFDPLAVLEELRIELNSFATQAGLRILSEMMRLEAEQHAGHRYQRHTEIDRWGRQSGWVRLGGQKVEIQRPRLRNKRTGAEQPLKTYRMFQQPQQQTEQIYERLIGGLSSRRYDHTVEQVVEGYGTSRSAVSRQMVTATAARLKELVERDLSGFDVRVLVIDAVTVGPAVHTVVVGIDAHGSKQVLGMRQGATENAVVCTDLLADLIERGLPNDRRRGLLVVLDGSKALAKAVRQSFGGRVQIQRCQVHKLRNVLSYLPEHLHAEYRRKITAAWAMNSYQQAVHALRDVVKELEEINSSAAASLGEGLEETLTVHRLDLPEMLRGSLRSTNIIESLFSGVRHRMKNVRRWRTSEQSARWTAAALLEAEKMFRRIKGCQDMPKLVSALNNLLVQ